MSKQRVEATVDVHEPTPVVKAVMDNKEVERFHLDALDSGDIRIGETAFERKTPSDFANSMLDQDNRLRDQVERMVEEHENVYVMVEGSLSDFEYLTHTNVEPQSLRGFAASIEARYNVGVKFCDTKPLLVDMAVRLARKHIENPSRELRVESSVEREAPVVKRMIACVDGVGADTADRIYEEFDSIPLLLQSVGDGSLEDVDGVGPKTASNIEKALTSKA